MAAPAHDTGAFDPLVELHGVWTPELADRYLPIPGMPPVKYECQDGHLIVSPYEGSANIFAADELRDWLKPHAKSLGGGAYTTLNIRLGPDSWIQPDFAVLREPARGRVWIPATQALLVGECVSPSSRVSDRIDKPAMCAEAGIEYFMRVEVSYAKKHAEVVLLRLGDEGVYEVHAKALAGDTFETREPFPLRFDPAELLED
ncbi:Uma2 family endonuclease [Actinopolyspora erythraea]|uniref:Uma2 family endonuclease n=1 Tax=Actinopolyspora erythraea TaxID=414996 RepID=A0A223RXL8_9ACTN|nr:Uma2 family endonuclease [Actinopolyspora erythraea]